MATRRDTLIIILLFLFFLLLLSSLPQPPPNQNATPTQVTPNEAISDPATDLELPSPNNGTEEVQEMPTNHAPLDTWHASVSWAPCYWDTTITHNGNPSWRNEGEGSGNPSEGGGTYKNREMNSYWIAVNPGDRIILSAWMRTDPSNLGTTSETCPQSGARIGLDFYGDEPYGRLQSLNYNPGGALPVKPEPTQGIIDNFVGWGTSTWSYREIDCIVPAKCYQVYPQGIVPNGVILWFGAMTNIMYGEYIHYNERASAWLSDTVFYINARQKTFTADTSLTTSISKPFTADTILYAQQIKPFTADTSLDPAAPPMCSWGNPSTAQWESFHSMGDVNRDGTIDITDFAAIGQKYGWVGTPRTLDEDINGDGKVDVLDLGTCGKNYGASICSYPLPVFQADSMLTSTGIAPFTVDAELLPPPSIKSFTADAYLQDTSWNYLGYYARMLDRIENIKTPQKIVFGGIPVIKAGE